MRHVTDVMHEWVMSRMHQSCHIWICHVWIIHVTYESVVSHMNESCHRRTSWASKCRWQSHINASCHILQHTATARRNCKTLVVTCSVGCMASRCDDLQCVAACCSSVQRVAVCCSVLQCIAVCCSALHWWKCTYHYIQWLRPSTSAALLQRNCRYLLSLSLKLLSNIVFFGGWDFTYHYIKWLRPSTSAEWLQRNCR